MINDRMPEYVTERVARLLNKHNKPLNGSKILVLGVAYKQDIDDYRESRALEVIRLMELSGAVVDYHDPHVDQYKYKGNIKKGVALNMDAYDLVVITTAHTNVNYESVAAAGVPILDAKNAMAKVKNRTNVELL